MTAMTRIMVFWRTCLLLLILFAAFDSSAQSGIRYIYDEAGRLIGVIDASGSAAAYNYDAVGNLLSISRYASNQVSVLSFSPKSGPAGTTVTISGTGYSATSGQDAVTFNGLTATITSAIANQLVVVVPTGATTGPISVTAPAGAFATPANFTVTSSNGVPSISSFVPTIATTATTVTISGTNFDANAANDRLKFNTTQQSAGSATGTTLSATVPASTASGRLSLLTTTGTAQSSQDLFIPFGSHVAGDVGFAGRTSLGSTQTITLSAKKKIALLVFDAVEGQSVSLTMSGSTFRSCTLYLFSPTASQLGSSGCTSGITSFGTVVLPITGTYTFGLDPLGNTGSIALKF